MANESAVALAKADDVRGLMRDLKTRNITASDLHEEPWGSLTQIELPGGGKLGIYQPKHARPEA